MILNVIELHGLKQLESVINQNKQLHTPKLIRTNRNTLSEIGRSSYRYRMTKEVMTSH